MFYERPINNSFKSAFMNTQKDPTPNIQDTQAPSHLLKGKIFERKPTTTQQNISSIHLTILTPYNKNNTPLPQTTLQPNA